MTTTRVNHILLRVPRLYSHDATSIDLLLQADLLRQAGWNVSIYARIAPTHLGPILTRSQALTLASDPRTIVMTYYCGYDRELELFQRVARGPFILRYHNVTPPEWFWRYSLRDAAYALLGRRQVRRMVNAGKFDLIAAASGFNISELRGTGKRPSDPPMVVVPPFTRYKDFVMGGEARARSKSLITALFVGRVAPNKGLHHIVPIIKSWNRIQPNARLHVVIAGKLSPALKSYHASLLAAARAACVDSQISFKFEVTAQELSTLYAMADLLLYPSEHEGFGVPLLEAQLAGLPIVALDRAAVKETMGEGGYCLKKMPVSYDEIAAAVAAAVFDSAERERLTRFGRENARRFNPEELIKKLATCLEECALNYEKTQQIQR